ncbi:hypothetical protein FHW89_003473 [Mucilaginibacter sp. SG564]|nr:hypothetical protein [Mucilaginibacter sp. SG564]
MFKNLLLKGKIPWFFLTLPGTDLYVLIKGTITSTLPRLMANLR